MPTKRVVRTSNRIEPYWQTRDGETARLYHGHSLRVLSSLPSSSVHTGVTSPPYWGLRDYRTGSADELGAEDTPEEYVDHLVAIFRELRRVLRDDGTFWLNLGDTYSGGGNRPGSNKDFHERWDGGGSGVRKQELGPSAQRRNDSCLGVPPGSLLGIPWRVALAMRADGWILRQEVIWAKPDCMPESVTNRCSRAHEQLFLFAKGTNYFYDSYAIREKATSPPHSPSNRKIAPEKQDRGHLEPRVWGDGWRNKRDVWTVSHGTGYGGNHFAVYPPELITPCILAGTSSHGCCPECAAPWRRILEKVRVATRPGKDSKVYGGARSSGLTGGLYAPPGQAPHSNARLAGEVTGNRDPARHVTEVRVLGWYPTCACDGLHELKSAPPVGHDWNPEANRDGQKNRKVIGNNTNTSRTDEEAWDPKMEGRYRAWVEGVRQECARAAEVRPPEELVPAVVLDPFIGSGTTALVCIEHGRRCVGIDLSEQHLQNDAIARIEGDLGGRPALRHLVPGRK
jgi:DNA modification methylase